MPKKTSAKTKSITFTLNEIVVLHNILEGASAGVEEAVGEGDLNQSYGVNFKSVLDKARKAMRSRTWKS